jgi:hypothetical protein
LILSLPLSQKINVATHVATPMIHSEKQRYPANTTQEIEHKGNDSERL